PSAPPLPPPLPPPPTPAPDAVPSADGGAQARRHDAAAVGGRGGSSIAAATARLRLIVLLLVGFTLQLLVVLAFRAVRAPPAPASAAAIVSVPVPVLPSDGAKDSSCGDGLIPPQPYPLCLGVYQQTEELLINTTSPLIEAVVPRRITKLLSEMTQVDKCYGTLIRAQVKELRRVIKRKLKYKMARGEMIN
ncbi:hypothetical protein EJB05_54407, partial [Eragrostis curvula]